MDFGVATLVYRTFLSSLYSRIFNNFFTDIVNPIWKTWNGGASLIVYEVLKGTFPFPLANSSHLRTLIGDLNFLIYLGNIVTGQFQWLLNQILSILNSNNLWTSTTLMLDSVQQLVNIYNALVSGGRALTAE